MTTLKAQVPQAHLATAMGTPNSIKTEYSTEILLPVSGPLALVVLVRDFTRWILDLARFLTFSEVAASYLKHGGKVSLSFGARIVGDPYAPYATDFETQLLAIARSAWTDMLDRVTRQPDTITSRSAKDILSGQGPRIVSSLYKPPKIALRPSWPRIIPGKGQSVPPRDMAFPDAIDRTYAFIIENLARPNIIFREAFYAGILLPTSELFTDEYTTARTGERLQLLLNSMIRIYPHKREKRIEQAMLGLVEMAIESSQRFLPRMVASIFEKMSDEQKILLASWLVIQHKRSRSRVPGLLGKDLNKMLGFLPFQIHREWAFRREEKLEMCFGNPSLRGPYRTEALPPQGTLSREEYTAAENELTLLMGKSTRQVSSEAVILSSGSLKSRLNTVYYAGQGSLGELTSDTVNNVFFTEERQSVVNSVLQEISRQQERLELARSVQISATTVTATAKGVDDKQSATHHRFRVVIPVHAKVHLEDVGLTWCPRISNPFMDLREVIRDEYIHAYNEYKTQNYVSVPIHPPITWDGFEATTSVGLGELEEIVTKDFEINIQTDLNNEGQDIRHTKADFARASVILEAHDSWYEYVPDSYALYLEDLSATEPLRTIRGTVVYESYDHSDVLDEAEGTAHVSIPIQRYTEKTIEDLANYEAELQDYERKVQAVESRAHQYALIKQRELIERHEEIELLFKIVFETLIRRICSLLYRQNHSYYVEILSNCIDWSRAKMQFESQPLNNLIYSEFVANHFMNSAAVRVFLPVLRTAETVFLDTLIECSTSLFRSSVEEIRQQITKFRERLHQRQSDVIQEFDTEMIIGDHIEAVISNHDFSS